MEVRHVSNIQTSAHAFLVGGDISGRNLTSIFIESSKHLAQDPSLRSAIGKQEQVWLSIGALWKYLRSSLSSTKDPAEEEIFLMVVLETARLVRNMVAGVPENQAEAIVSEDDFGGIIHWLSSYYHGLDDRYYASTRMLVQMLSNTVTCNDTLIPTLWNKYMNYEDDRNIFSRLLVIPDTQIRTSTHIFILNCIRGNYHRTHQLAVTRGGVQTCIILLDRVKVLLDGDGNSEDDELQLIIQIIDHLCQLSLASTLWKCLGVEDEPVTPQQITFLKLIDARLHRDSNIDVGSHDFVGHALHHLLECTQTCLSDVLERTREVFDPRLVTVDRRLPHIFEAIILLNQCTISILLSEAELTTREARFQDSLLIQRRFVEAVIDCLRLLDAFLPRILWGKIQPSHTPLSSLVDSSMATDLAAFSYMKRDLVRLLGIMCYKQKDIQDRVRNCGGILVVLNLCVVDERNPYLREHALFTLRNLLVGNDENQKRVAELEPMGVWTENGELKDIPGRVRR